MRAAFLLAWLALLSGPVYAASTSITLSVVIAPVGTTMLLGLFGGENQGFSSCIHVTNCTQPNGYAGRFPDFTEDQSYMGPGGGDPSHWDLGYPFVAGFSTVDNQSSADGKTCGGYNDMAAAARGDYDAIYQAVINNGLKGGPGRPYAVRINWEWDGWWFCHSPWPYELAKCNTGQCWDEYHPKWTPAIWIGAVRRLAGLIKATPGLQNVKIQCDAPSNEIQKTYYPGDGVCDLLGTDMYFNQLYDGDSPLGSWNRHIDMLNYKSAFAAAHNKPMFIGEWCDTYADGSNIPRFAAWMKANNVVGHVYWNTDLDIGAPAGCSLARSDAPARKAAYIAAFGGTSYQGTYWPMPLLTLPAGNPTEY